MDRALRTPHELYEQALAEGGLIRDPEQEIVIARLDDQPVKRADQDCLPQNLQPVRFEDLVQKHEDHDHDEPAINDRGHGVQGEGPLVALWQERIVRLFKTETPFPQLAVEDGGGLLPQIRNLHDVGQDVFLARG